MDIVGWLRSLGLEQYEQAFRDNAIDAEAVLELTDADLEKLGVLLGHRKRLLKAIAALRGPMVHQDGTIPARTDEVADSRRAARPAAERRQLTIMLCDLVGSTALSARLDPEEMREVLHAYQNTAADAVAHFEGHVAKYMGDGVLAYFGYPRTHEDEAERAVRAGLAIVEAVRALKSPNGKILQVRVGIATGPVVVGDLIGEGAAREETVVGETPNLAARLQTLAEPDTVVIGSHTRRLVGGLFDLADLGMHTLKGLPTPVRAWRVLGESRAESRFDALRSAVLTPFVGREHELGLVLDRWERAKEGEGQVVLLCGEPGIGKSRLVRALREQLGREAHTFLSHYCSQHHQTSPLHPVIELLERAAGFERDDQPEQRLNKLEALLSLSADNTAGVAPLIAALLRIPTGERYPPINMTPQRQKELTLESLVDQLVGLAGRQPVVAVYEDVHWSDPTTLELLDRVVERIQTLRVLVIVTFRPEFVASWTRYAHVSSLTLGRLSRRQGAAMVERVAGGKSLPASILERIVAKTDGVPLFVEELTRAVFETGLLKDTGGNYVLSSPLPSLEIPATLQDSLMARLDRLAPAREAAQVGAAIGREFSHELLAAVAQMPERSLKEGLADLIDAGLVFRRGSPPQANYAFKHALVQDAAYATLLRDKRRQLHARIAEVLERMFPGIAEAEPELLALHCAEAGLAEKAVEYWLKAGRSAIERSATAEAIAQLTKGLELLASLPEDVTRWQRELDLQIALGVALMAAKGWAAPETGRVNARARELCDQIGETPLLFPVLYGQWVFHVVRAELFAGQEVGKELLRRAEQRRDTAAQVVGHRILGTGFALCGELVDARVHLERALALYDPEQHQRLAFLYAQDPRVAGLSGLSWALLALGYLDLAQARSREAIDAAQALSHPNTLAYALLYGSVFSQLSRNRWEMQDRVEALAALATEQGFPHFLGAAKAIQGWRLAETDDARAGLEQIREGLAAWRATGAGFCVPYFMGLQAEAHGRANRPQEGLELLAEALTLVNETGERLFEAELHRLRGKLLRGMTVLDSAEPEASFRQALAVARGQSARLWELRAATSLARFLAEGGESLKGRKCLRPILAWFTEGLDTPDLQQAKELFDTWSDISSC
ncbi:MAG TPA: AAA family ATPase [Dongiaceae bacterium]|nr:AAA family ATPase [Dongiaceae bacterium]